MMALEQWLDARLSVEIGCPAWEDLLGGTVVLAQDEDEDEFEEFDDVDDDEDEEFDEFGDDEELEEDLDDDYEDDDEDL